MLRQIQYFQAVVRCGSFTEATASESWWQTGQRISNRCVILTICQL
ncbi:LysR family transcriptional regulator [Anaerovoracaceae bacterium 41-7]